MEAPGLDERRGAVRYLSARGGTADGVDFCTRIHAGPLKRLVRRLWAQNDALLSRCRRRASRARALKLLRLFQKSPNLP